MKFQVLIVSIFLLLTNSLYGADLVSENLTIISHRGSPFKHAENTIQAFQTSLKEGGNAIELDVCITKDGRVVVWHDWKHSDLTPVVREIGKEPDMLYRPWVPNLGSRYRRPISELTYAEFKKHYGYTEASNNFLGGAKKSEKYQTMTLEEFAMWAVKQKKLKKIFVDLKAPKDAGEAGHALVQQSLKILEKYGLHKKSILSTTESEYLKRAPIYKKQYPGVGFAFDTQITALKADFNKHSGINNSLKIPGLEHAMIGLPRIGFNKQKNYLDVIKKELLRLNAHNREVIRTGKGTPIKSITAWTIDDPILVEQLLRLGVDSIMTNKPDMVRRIHEKLKMERDAEKPEQALKESLEQLKKARKKMEEARDRWKNRPWWKFWLPITNSDKKEFEKAMLEYQFQTMLFHKIKERYSKQRDHSREKSKKTYSSPGGKKYNFSGKLQALQREYERNYRIYLSLLKNRVSKKAKGFYKQKVLPLARELKRKKAEIQR
ncbi:glycerophosphodiester phosphodiesterase [Candidatus Riflebacteria bacterium]